MIDLEQLKADREAGAGGRWLKSDTRDGSVFFSAPESQLEWIDFASVVVEVDGEVDLEGVANARRIARLPDLEAAYIEAVAKLDKAVEAFSEAMEENERLKEALWDSVDKATKMQGNEK